ncbi:DUF930 domain-containing protein [Stappia sp. ES.058]|uniref:DUF930 domain-containing protein n=1 Tax=Stappia sp. ES.058 TaxID=1881061 RepID=UPI00087D0FE8|nr:DUF930 domain-containing protein [Stappia sp. ES.058]SDU28116.1 protein of unknown function [Stappia sp. ES.058]
MVSTPSDLPEIVPGPAPAREDGRPGSRLFLVGVAASVLLHGLIVLLFIETPPREMETPEAEPIEVVLVPPPQAPAPEEPVVEEPAAEEPAPEPEPEQEQEEEDALAPEPQPEAEEEAPEPEQPEALPPPAPDADSLPVLQPVEEFAEESSEAAGGEEGDPRDGALLPAEDEPRPEEPVGEDGDAEVAETVETQEADEAEPVVPEPVTETPVETEAGTEADPSATEEPSPEDAPVEETPTEDVSTEDVSAEETPAGEETETQEAVAEPAPEETAPETDIIAGPEAEGETAPFGETAVEEAPRSAPEADGLSGAIATTLPRAKPPLPPGALRAAARAAEQGDLPPGVRLPGNASEPARRPGAPRLARARELFSDRILGDSRARTAMAGMSGPQRLNLLCLTELRAQIRDLYPDRPAEILPSFRPQPGTVLAPVRAAYRSRGAWYDLDFRCETDPAVTRVENFSFRVGPPVPRSEWRSRGFPQN